MSTSALSADSPQTPTAAAERRILPAHVAVWLAAFVPVTYLALSGGGYDLLARSEVGLLVWWLVLLGAVAGLLPRRRLGTSGWAALALLAGFGVWTWIAASWSLSDGRTLAEVARVATYLGVFAVCAFGVTRGAARALLGGLTSAIAFVCGLAVLSRLAPQLFPHDTAQQFYATARLSYPFDYSDGVGEFAALGLPLLLGMAGGARTRAGRSAAAAALPLVILCLAMTVSRGGILAAVIGVAAFLALSPERLRALPTVVLSAAGGALLMIALIDRAGVRNELEGHAPAGQRHSLLAITIVVLLATGAIHAGAGLLAPRSRASISGSRAPIPRSHARLFAGGWLALLAIVVAALFATGAAHTLWQEFKRPNPPTGHSEYVRLLSVAGSHRYQYWQAAVSAFRHAPVKGIGPGTFEFWWAQRNTLHEFVRNAHSLWIETLAEAGIVGLALILGFFLCVLIGGAALTLRVPPEDAPDSPANVESRRLRASAVAGVAAFCAAAAFDWVWQIGVVPIIAMALAAVALAVDDGRRGPGAEPDRADGMRRPLPRARVALALATLPALWAIAGPLATTVAIRASQDHARTGALRAALNDAATAQSLEPGSAAPRLQRALVLEQLGDVPGAAGAIAAAEAREASNWRIWLVASRIATERNRPAEALADYRRARALDPTSPIFAK